MLDEDDAKPAVFIASGTGFAPIKSLIEHAMNLEFRAPMRLYWHVPGIQEPYAHNLCRSWGGCAGQLRLPVVRGAGGWSTMGGRTRRVVPQRLASPR